VVYENPNPPVTLPDDTRPVAMIPDASTGKNTAGGTATAKPAATPAVTPAAKKAADKGGKV